MKPPALRLPMRVWDLPTRLFHWVIVLLVAVSYVSVTFAGSNYGLMRVHLISGYSILALLLFRLAWGFIGSDTARFTTFLGSPLAGFRYLARFGARGPDDQIGHNAAGGWMVLIMLGLLAAQVGTGLFSNDDGATEGPLARFVAKATSDRLSGLHGTLFNVLLAAIILHVVAILAYAVVRRHDLIRPMITGKKRLPATARAPRMVSPLLALIVLGLAALVVVALVTVV
jgi:cytochrome b